jgi:hypothetical protein
VNVQSLSVGFTLDPVELSVLRQAFGVRAGLFPLRLGATTVAPVRLVALARTVGEELDRRGLSVAGRLNPEVLAAFELLAEHRVAVSISGSRADGADITVLALADGARAVTVTQLVGDDLRFVLSPAGELTGALVAALPPVPAAAGGPVVVGGRSADEPRTDAFGNIIPGGGTHPDLLAGPRLGGGVVLASWRGRRGASSESFGWVDTARGRYLVRSATDRSGTVTARYQPAGPRELAQAMTGLLGESR